MTNNLIPQGYKLTDLGVIPEDWAVVRLGEVFSFCTNTIRVSEFDNKMYIGTENMLPNKQGVKFNTSDICYYAVREYKTHDILISNIRPYLKKIWLSNYCGGCSSDVLVVRLNDNSAYVPLFMYYLLSDDEFFKFSMDNAIGTKMPRGDKKVMKEYNLIIPQNIEEQQKIAEVLRDIDLLIEGLKQKIAKKRAIKEGAMQQLLTGKKRLSGFSEPWVERRLGDNTNIKTGSRNGDESVEGGLYPLYVRSQIVQQINTYSYNEEAILVPGEGGIGEIFHYIIGKFDCHQRVYKISNFSDAVDAKFLFYYLKRYFGEYALQQSVKATVESLRLPTFTEFTIFTPPTKTEQQAIAQILTDIDNEIAELEQKQKKYTTLKQGAMQKLLTGQIRL